MGEMWGRYGETWYELRVPHPGLEMWGDMGEMWRRYEEIWGDLRSVCRIQASRYGEILGGDEAAPRPQADDVDRDLCLAAVHAPAWCHTPAQGRNMVLCRAFKSTVWSTRGTVAAHASEYAAA